MTATVDLGGTLFQVAVSPTTGYVYVANDANQLLQVIDPATNSIIAEIVLDYPQGVAVAPDGATVYVTDVDYAYGYAIDTTDNTFIEIPVEGAQRWVAVGPL